MSRHFICSSKNLRTQIPIIFFTILIYIFIKLLQNCCGLFSKNILFQFMSKLEKKWMGYWKSFKMLTFKSFKIHLEKKSMNTTIWFPSLLLYLAMTYSCQWTSRLQVFLETWFVPIVGHTFLWLNLTITRSLLGELN